MLFDPALHLRAVGYRCGGECIEVFTVLHPDFPGPNSHELHRGIYRVLMNLVSHRYHFQLNPVMKWQYGIFDKITNCTETTLSKRKITTVR